MRTLRVEEFRRPHTQSGKAVAAFALGFLSIITSVLVVTFDSYLIFLGSLALTIVSFVLGILGRREVSESDGLIRGHGLATWGVIASLSGVLLGFLALPIFWRTIDSMNLARSRGNLEKIVKALHTATVDHNQRFPPAAKVEGPGNKPLLSWRVLILPALDERELFDSFALEEPWDSPKNQALLDRMPSVFAPVGNVTCEPGSTFYQLLVGQGAVYDSMEMKPTPGEIPDGPSNTLLVVEAGEAVPWTKPADAMLSQSGNPPKLGGLFNGSGSRFIFWLRQHDGFNAAFADGRSVHFFPRDYPQDKLKAWITRSGNEPIGREDLP